MLIKRTVVWLALVIASLTVPVAADQAAATNKPGSLVLTVAGESGKPIDDVKVVAHGPADRAGTTGADGVVTLVNLPAGTYRCRITRDGFITLDKEVVIRAGVRATSEAVLNNAPPPPAPPPAAPPPPPVTKSAPSTLKPGQPTTNSISDLGDAMVKALRNTPTVERDLGCSGATTSKLIMTRENIAAHDHADADEMIYIVAGEATLTLGGKDQPVTPAWFAVVPRGMSHTLTIRGRNPLLVLSVKSGPPCPGL